MTTKIDAVVDGLGNPLRFVLTRSDIKARAGHSAEKDTPRVACDYALYCDANSSSDSPEDQAFQMDRKPLRTNPESLLG
jgi:hypothetical protein